MPIYFRLGGLAKGPWRDVTTGKAVAQWYENPIEKVKFLAECAKLPDLLCEKDANKPQ